jgi:hypothetical protein
MPAQTVAAWDAARKAESAKAVEDGRPPLERMSTPPVPHLSLGHPVTLFVAQDGKLYCAAHAAPGRPPRLARADDMPLSGLGDMCVFADEAALAAGVRLLRASGNERAARAVPYLARQGFCSYYVCLTTALATRFWSPFSGQATLGQWGKAFRVGGGPGVGAMMATARNLYEILASGQEPLTNVLQAADMLASCALRPGQQFLAYDASRSLSEQWGAICRRDPALAERAMLSGEVVRFELPLRFGGGLVTGRVSAPCRLRTGSVLVHNHDGLEAVAELKGFLSHDDLGNEGLFARLQVPSRGPNFERLLESWLNGDKWLLTAWPRTSRPVGNKGRAMWLTGRRVADKPDAVEREAPVDVLLAGS